MDNKTIYHMCGEAIVIAGLSAYFFKQNKALQEQITQLKTELDKQKKENEKVFSTIFNVLDTHLNARQPVPQPVPQPQQVRKRNVAPKPQSSPQPQQVVKQQEKAKEEVEVEATEEEDIQDEMNSLLRDDEEMDVIDITKETEVKPQDMVMVVTMTQ